MSEVAETIAPKQEEKTNIFSEEKNIVVPKQEAKEPATDPTIKEKDKNIKEEKPTVTKSNEPEKIPNATPKDIPARTEEDNKLVEPKSEIKFANKTSENIFNLLTAEGKTEAEAEDALYDYLSKKKTIASLDKLPAADKIKLQLKSENKDYSAEEINDLFNENYVYPEKPEQHLEETDEDFKVREDKYNDKVAKLERRIEREGKKAASELLKQNENLVLPNIPKPEPKVKEPTQEDLEATAKARENYLTSIGDGLDNFKSIDATYKDKEVEIPVAYKISAEERSALRQQMENFNLEQFIQERWLTEDGKFNTAQQAKDLFMLLHGEKAIAKLVNEAGTKKEAEVRKSIRSVDYSGTNRSGTLAPDVQEEIGKAVKHFFAN